jgi:hypothetical protein
MSYEEVTDEKIVLSVENGAARTSLHPSSPSTERLIASTSRTTTTSKPYSLVSAAQHWNNVFTPTKSTFAKPFQNVNQAIRCKFRNPRQKAQDEMTQTIHTIPVKQVVKTPDSTVLPSTAVHIPARRSRLLGQPLGIDRVQEFARSIQRRCARQGSLFLQR